MGGGVDGGKAKVAGFEPVTLFAAPASFATRLDFIAPASTTYEEPCNTARKCASLDLVSGGRTNWNVVTSAAEAAARNLNRDE